MSAPLRGVLVALAVALRVALWVARKLAAVLTVTAAVALPSAADPEARYLLQLSESRPPCTDIAGPASADSTTSAGVASATAPGERCYGTHPQLLQLLIAPGETLGFGPSAPPVRWYRAGRAWVEPAAFLPPQLTLTLQHGDSGLLLVSEHLGNARIHALSEDRWQRIRTAAGTRLWVFVSADYAQAAP
ncbi:MAG: hypothetical protein R3E86_02505 [Pseudomonadales bacterium]